MKMKNLLMITIAIFGFALISNAQIPNYVPSNGLVGWWPFNGNANDESLNGNNGTVNGATLTSDRFGNSENAFSFDGISNDINVTHNNSLNALPISISVWFKTIVSQQNKMIVNKYVCESRDGYSFQLSNNKPSAFYFSDGQGDNNYLSLDPISSNFQSLNDDLWHNGLLIIESDSSKVYIDGVLIHSDVVNGQLNLTSTTEKLRFGSYPIGNCGGPQNFYYEGQIDDIGIWNRALTLEEITSLYYGSSLVVNEVSQSKLFSVFPNPAHSLIYVNLDTKLVGSEFSIYNNIGKVVKTGKINSVNTTIELNDLLGGIYTFNLGENRKQTFKVIKE